MLPAADEVNDFVVVTGLDLRAFPLSAKQNLEVAFDGHSAGVNAEMSEQAGDSEAVGDLFVFAVDDDVHVHEGRARGLSE